MWKLHQSISFGRKRHPTLEFLLRILGMLDTLKHSEVVNRGLTMLRISWFFWVEGIEGNYHHSRANILFIVSYFKVTVSRLLVRKARQICCFKLPILLKHFPFKDWLAIGKSAIHAPSLPSRKPPFKMVWVLRLLRAGLCWYLTPEWADTLKAFHNKDIKYGFSQKSL